MPDHLPYTLQSTSSAEFRANGERTHLLNGLARVRPDLTREVRVAIVRMIERGLDALGRDALNLAITDLPEFERRLALSTFVDHGYPGYFRRRLQWAVRFLHAAGHEADADYLATLLAASRPTKADADRAGATAFPIASSGGHRPHQRTRRRRSASGPRTSTRRRGQSGTSKNEDATGFQQPARLQDVETAIVNGIQGLDGTIQVDQELVQHLVPICLQRMSPTAKLTLLRRFTADLERELARDSGVGGDGGVDAIAEKLIAQILYPRVTARVCGPSGSGHNDRPCQ